MASKMKLYLLVYKIQHDRNYDKAQGFVIAASNTRQARKLAANNCGDEGGGFWLDHTRAKISCIADSSKYSSPRIVMRDFING